ncbi:hypothetical protein FRZ61_08650 [Hypericibacter adhaerens]|uniref:Uncharacterized protein n=1 Tax=Hypericibacter adhaerens TaxID=2602016 RepID=A0A5J6MW68_9PROT|nr:hypothetical protein FRZ61_08650 [Hypericibacter adhaerens]
MADGARREMQLVRRQLEALQAAGRLEEAQGGKGRKLQGHVRRVLIYPLSRAAGEGKGGGCSVSDTAQPPS